MRKCDVPYRKGNRVIVSGVGRTARWPNCPGTVLQVLTGHSVEVRWDTACFSTDEMELSEIKPYQEA